VKRKAQLQGSHLHWRQFPLDFASLASPPASCSKGASECSITQTRPFPLTFSVFAGINRIEFGEPPSFHHLSVTERTDLPARSPYRLKGPCEPAIFDTDRTDRDRSFQREMELGSVLLHRISKVSIKVVALFLGALSHSTRLNFIHRSYNDVTRQMSGLTPTFEQSNHDNQSVQVIQTS
jgi:hypothetical protein